MGAGGEAEGAQLRGDRAQLVGEAEADAGGGDVVAAVAVAAAEEPRASGTGRGPPALSRNSASVRP